MNQQKLVELVLELEREVRKLRAQVHKEKFYSIEHVAEITGKTEKTIRSHIKAGKLRCYYPHSKHCILDVDLDRYQKGETPLRGKRKK